LRANHHGSDTSNGEDFIAALDPEVAVIPAHFRRDYGHPKLVAIKQLTDAGAMVYITGNGQDPDGEYTQSDDAEDDGFTPPDSLLVNQAGDVHILVSTDGTRYRVFGGGQWREFSALEGGQTPP
jgi:hypothetical protein